MDDVRRSIGSVRRSMNVLRRQLEWQREQDRLADENPDAYLEIHNYQCCRVCNESFGFVPVILPFDIPIEGCTREEGCNCYATLLEWPEGVDDPTQIWMKERWDRIEELQRRGEFVVRR